MYTRLGDDGSTGRLFGGRLSKADPTVDCYGTVDEAGAALGVARAAGAAPDLAQIILGLQRDLFVVAADLACNPRQRRRLRPRVSLVVADMVGELERIVDRVVAEHPLRPVFVVPGANPVSATLDLARTVVRRAERQAVQVQSVRGTVNPLVITYLNRVSDLIYVLARWAAAGSEEPASHL
ncbi:MAG: cob(I)yrinic acid a,c-diamide adenosyltransferase [Candidatus Dormibacteria bacterium]